MTRLRTFVAEVFNALTLESKPAQAQTLRNAIAAHADEVARLLEISRGHSVLPLLRELDLAALGGVLLNEGQMHDRVIMAVSTAVGETIKETVRPKALGAAVAVPASRLTSNVMHRLDRTFVADLARQVAFKGTELTDRLVTERGRQALLAFVPDAALSAGLSAIADAIANVRISELDPAQTGVLLPLQELAPSEIPREVLDEIVGVVSEHIDGRQQRHGCDETRRKATLLRDLLWLSPFAGPEEQLAVLVQHLGPVIRELAAFAALDNGLMERVDQLLENRLPEIRESKVRQLLEGSLGAEIACRIRIYPGPFRTTRYGWHFEADFTPVGGGEPQRIHFEVNDPEARHRAELGYGAFMAIAGGTVAEPLAALISRTYGEYDARQATINAREVAEVYQHHGFRVVVPVKEIPPNKNVRGTYAVAGSLLGELLASKQARKSYKRLARAVLTEALFKSGLYLRDPSLDAVCQGPDSTGSLVDTIIEVSVLNRLTRTQQRHLIRLGSAVLRGSARHVVAALGLEPSEYPQFAAETADILGEESDPVTALGKIAHVAVLHGYNIPDSIHDLVHAVLVIKRGLQRTGYDWRRLAFRVVAVGVLEDVWQQIVPWRSETSPVVPLRNLKHAPAILVPLVRLMVSNREPRN